MRPVTDEAGADAPVLQSDVVVREAARAVLAAQGPVKVAEGDKIVGHGRRRGHPAGRRG